MYLVAQMPYQLSQEKNILYNRQENIVLEGFKKFIVRGNVVDLTVGIVVGAAFNSAIQAFVKGVFTPFLGVIGGIPDFSNLAIKIGRSTIQLGEFLNALISFIIVATAVYFFIVIPMNTIKDLANKGKNSDPTTKRCPFCISEISIKAVRCPQCTSKLEEAKK